mmetsp:Transcript_12022/g.25974  ORF Transcript_12022/g.25974 Transcript_12022/m.25974 type:complete len:217 (-) Transcript_12022:32-682(-)
MLALGLRLAEHDKRGLQRLLLGSVCLLGPLALALQLNLPEPLSPLRVVALQRQIDRRRHRLLASLARGSLHFARCLLHRLHLLNGGVLLEPLPQARQCRLKFLLALDGRSSQSLLRPPFSLALGLLQCLAVLALGPLPIGANGELGATNSRLGQLLRQVLSESVSTSALVCDRLLHDGFDEVLLLWREAAEREHECPGERGGQAHCLTLRLRGPSM